MLIDQFFANIQGDKLVGQINYLTASMTDTVGQKLGSKDF